MGPRGLSLDFLGGDSGQLFVILNALRWGMEGSRGIDERVCGFDSWGLGEGGFGGKWSSGNLKNVRRGMSAWGMGGDTRH